MSLISVKLFLLLAHRANPYAIWVFAYNNIFSCAVEYLEEITDPEQGSVEEALISVLGKAMG